MLHFAYLCQVMARILSIDFGRKRTGIAVTDTLKIIASGLATVPTGELLSFLMHYFEQEDVELVVIGLPRQMNNVPSENMRYIEPFVVQFKKQFPQMPIVYFDERFTSSLAHRVMLDGGLKKKDRQNKALVDEISATIILQDYLESKQYKERL
jgi:RNAse H domain protein, YqgF family